MSDTIVVGTDGSESANRALDEACRLAQLLDASLHVVSAFAPSNARVTGAPEGAAKVWAPHPDDEVERILGEASSAVRLKGLTPQPHAVRGSAADALLEVAEEVGATLIVVGNRGMTGARRALGSVPNSVSHHARCNVLIVATGTH